VCFLLTKTYMEVGNPETGILNHHFRVARDSGTSIGSFRHGWLTFHIVVF
jgi:hypothetical protein